MFFACRLKTPFVPRTRTISSALSVITSANTNQTLPQGKKQQKLNQNNGQTTNQQLQTKQIYSSNSKHIWALVMPKNEAI